MCRQSSWCVVAGLLTGLEAYMIYMCVLANNANSAAGDNFNAATVVTAGETLACSSIYTVDGDQCILAPNMTQIFTICLNLCSVYASCSEKAIDYCFLGACWFVPLVLIPALVLAHYRGNDCCSQSENEQGFYGSRLAVNYSVEEENHFVSMP